TNSLEALEDSVARGHTFIEVDISWTSDDELVLLHDWTQTTKRLFVTPPGPPLGQMTFAEFMAAKSRIGQTQLDLDGLLAWLGAHPEVVIVTDVKGRSLEALERIARAEPALLPRIVPQLYSIEEHEPVTALGYPRVILTLYATPMEDDEVLAYAAEHAPLAVTMPLARGAGPLPRALDELGVFSYAHTTSDYLAAAELFRNGVDGVYTDYLAPEDEALAFHPSVAPPWSVREEHVHPLTHGAVTFLPMAPGLVGQLVVENPGDAAVDIAVLGYDAGGAEAGRVEQTVAAGARDEVPLDGLDASATTLRVEAGDLPVSMTWELLDRPSLDIAVARDSVEMHLVTGRSDGLDAHAVLLFNPTDSVQIYRCEQLFRPVSAQAASGRGTIVRSAWLRVPPNGMARQVFPLTGPAAVRLRVSGGPVVAQPLRWSSTYSILR
ncbi:MAG: glycerophosphodiester phosphodiesterase family protein, partial [Planctomycetota bacterium]